MGAPPGTRPPNPRIKSRDAGDGERAQPIVEPGRGLLGDGDRSTAGLVARLAGGSANLQRAIRCLGIHALGRPERADRQKPAALNDAVRTE